MGSRTQLQADLEAVPDVNRVYFQAPTNTVEPPYIVYEPTSSFVQDADNLKYFLKKGYTVTVVDRATDSLIPDRIEQFENCRFDRFFRTNGLNHFVFQLYY